MPFHEYFHFSESQTRSHSLSINLKPLSINPYRYSFFINTPFLWNSIPVSILKISQTKLFRNTLCHSLFNSCNYNYCNITSFCTVVVMCSCCIVLYLFCTVNVSNHFCREVPIAGYAFCVTLVC